MTTTLSESRARIAASRQLRDALNLITAARAVLGDECTMALLLSFGLDVPQRCQRCGQWRDQCDLNRHKQRCKAVVCKYCRETKRLRDAAERAEPCKPLVSQLTIDLRRRLNRAESERQKLARKCVRLQEFVKRLESEGART